MTSPWFMSCWNAVKHLVLSARYEIFFPSVAQAVVFEIFPPFSCQDDKSVVYVMLERSEASCPKCQL